MKQQHYYPDAQELGLRIKAARQDQHLTQATLAEYAEMNSVYMGRIERGEVCIKVITLCKIASALNVPADWFLSKHN